MRLVVDHGQMLPQYVIGLLTMPVVKRQLRRKAKDAVAQSSINQQDVEGCLLPCPSLHEQQMVVERANALRSRVSDELRYKDKLQRLKSGLMQDLLTGAVRVPEAEAAVQEVVA
jgi:type I restriction enzyme S subunit